MADPEDPVAAKRQPLPANQIPHRPTWAEIDLGALVWNFRALRQLLEKSTQPGDASASWPAPVSQRRLIPVVKANAYGHGAVQVARALLAAGATAFAVAIVEEGVELREAGIREEILVLEGAWAGQEAALVRHRLTATVYTAAGVRRLDQAARAMQEPVRVHVKVDTGMSRLGAPWDAMDELLDSLRDAPALRTAGVFSHLACAEEEDPSYTAEQTRRFRHALERIEKKGLSAGEVHLANSGGLLYRSSLRMLSARPGIALYGYPPAPERCPVELKPVLTLKTRVGRIHTIRAGESTGYSRRFIAPRDMRAATLPVGYADGYRRGLTGRGQVILHGRALPVLGAVSMDMIVVDVTDLPGVKEEDEVILLGSAPGCRVDAADWASRLETIPYEVLCGISPRVPRVYRDAGHS